MPDTRPPTVVLVHGLWMNGLELLLLRSRLTRCGYRVRRFVYRTVAAPIDDGAVRLRTFLDGLDAERVHLVGHSLGGLVILRMFETRPPPQVGRIVVMGTPYHGSGVARRLAATGIGRGLLGRSVERALLGSGPRWQGGRELGVIAGSLNFGVGRLIGGLAQPSDGTVAVAETDIPGATDKAVLPVSHTGLVLSSAAAAQVCAFLRNGRFAPAGE